MNRRKIALAILLAATLTAWGTLRAQTFEPAVAAITIAGGDVSNGNSSLSFSCGEVATQYAEQKAFTVVNITESFNEGVQQPYTERDKSNNGITPLDVRLDVYPNPATDCVNIEGDGFETLQYTIYTANGQQLQQGQFDGNQERIDLSGYATGNYMLRIGNKDNTKINTYKIILVR